MIDWLVQTEHDLPPLPAESWLSPAEQERLSTLRIEKRRRDWLLGRWTARRLVQAWAERELGQIPTPEQVVILAAADGSPQMHARENDLHTALAALRLTISHSHGRAFCALGPTGLPVGADIERVAPRHPAFADDYFTPGELQLIADARPAMRDTLVTAIWSAKEAVLKALRLGLTVDTRRVECLVPLTTNGVPPDEWVPFVAHCDPALGVESGSLSCWWRCIDDFVLTLAIHGEGGRVGSRAEERPVAAPSGIPSSYFVHVGVNASVGRAVGSPL